MISVVLPQTQQRNASIEIGSGTMRHTSKETPERRRPGKFN
jgi:hypothetical protein